MWFVEHVVHIGIVKIKVAEIINGLPIRVVSHRRPITTIVIGINIIVTVTTAVTIPIVVSGRLRQRDVTVSLPAVATGLSRAGRLFNNFRFSRSRTIRSFIRNFIFVVVVVVPNRNFDS